MTKSKKVMYESVLASKQDIRTFLPEAMPCGAQKKE